MSRVGVGPNGRVLVGWDHVAHCIGRLLSTEIGSRVQRRDFGSLVPRLLDRPQNSETIVDFYMAIAEALEPRKKYGSWYGEPGFRLTKSLLAADVPGDVVLALIGDYYPRGHLGDFSRTSPKHVTYSVGNIGSSIEFVSAG